MPALKGQPLYYTPGTCIGGHYEIECCLERGAHATIYLCRNWLQAGGRVVLKVLAPALAADPALLARFCKEFVASSRIIHRNVLRTFDFLHIEESAAFVTEYADGGDLAHLLDQRSQLPLVQALSIAEQVCAGVAAIHAAEIVHRDLKPENIFFTKSGDVKIGDFGVAQLETGHKLTQHGAILGTISYISPEYVQIGKVDTRSDIYALGMVLYEMITGTLPFRHTDSLQRLMQRVQHPPEPPSIHRPDCPAALNDAIMIALATDPAERFQTAEEFGRTLRTISEEIHRRQVERPVVESGEFQVPRLPARPAPAQAAAESLPFTPKVSRRPASALVSLVLGALFLGIGLSELFATYGRELRSAIAPRPAVQARNVEVVPVSFLPEATQQNVSAEKGEEAAPPEPPGIEPREIAGAPKRGSDVVRHKVRRGETLSLIALKHGIPVRRIVALNVIENPDRLEIGQVLLIPHQP